MPDLFDFRLASARAEARRQVDPDEMPGGAFRKLPASPPVQINTLNVAARFRVQAGRAGFTHGGSIMARVVAHYRGCVVELDSDGRRGVWRYRVRQEPGEIVMDGEQALVDVGPFESCAAAYQDAVRRISLLVAPR